MAPRSLRQQQDAEVLALLRRHARRLAETFELPLRQVHAESPRVRRRYGVCYDDGTIKVRLRSVRTGELLRESSLVDTLCHELAHLRHFNHGSGFQKLYDRILGYARRHGIYRPGQASRWRFASGPSAPAATIGSTPPRARRRPVKPPGPLQLELF